MPTKHNRNYGAKLLCLTLACITPAVLAANEDAIARCARIPSVGDRILCLEDALRQASAADESEQARVPDSEPASDVVGAAPADEDNVSGVTGAVTGAAAIDAPEPITASKPVQGATVGPAPEASIGEEQVSARGMTEDDKRAALESAENLRVVRYSTVPYRRLVIELDNGQVWRQIKGDVQEIRVDLRRNQTVDITESRLGGYQMRLNEMRRTLRVERVR